MAWITLLTFLGLPLGFGTFFCWRAYQLAIRGRTELAHQWLFRETPGIERYAKLFAIRDLIFAFGCLLFIGLLFAMPAYFTVWSGVLAVFGGAYQCITLFAMQKVSSSK